MTEAETAAPLSLKDVAIGYGKAAVARNITLSLARGELLALVALNGQGKTTLLKTILDLMPVLAGEIALFGRRHSDPNSRRHLVFLPEQFHPSPHLTGWEALSFGQAAYGRRLDRDAARALAERMDLDPGALPRRVTTYSKGMGQKLGLIGALLTETPLLILDEPMSGLDPRARARLKDCLTDCRAMGRTVLFSSHILADVDQLCDRIAVLHGGALRYLGPPAGLRSAPDQTLEDAFLARIESPEVSNRAV